MPASCCGDPLEAPCGWGQAGFPLALSTDEATRGALLSLDQDDVVEPPQNTFLEVRCSRPHEYQAVAMERPWSLWLEFLADPAFHDLAVIDPVLEAARAAGCNQVVAPGVSGEYQYRYRLFSLIRMLCDYRKCKFSICESEALPLSDRLNHYLASKRGCCRHPNFRPDSKKV